MLRALSAVVVPAFVLSSVTSAQIQTDWALLQSFNPAGRDQTYDVAFAPSGSIYAGGRTGLQTAFLVKYDASGSPIWSQTWTGGGTHIDSVYALAVIPSDESVYGVGRVDPPAGNTSGLVLRYDANGNLLWSAYAQLAGGTTQLAAAVVRPNGNLVAAGSSGLGVVFVTEYTPQGTQLWLSTAPGGDYAFDLALDQAGNAIVSGPFDETPTGTKFGVAKFSPTGTLLWLRTVTNGDGIESGHAVLPDASGAIYAVGRRVDPVTGPNALLVKLDPAGNVLWTREEQGSVTGPSSSATFSGVSFARNGNVRVAGTVTNTGAGTDLRAAEYTPAGTRVWGGDWNGPLSFGESFLGSFVDDDGAQVIAGSSTGIWGGPDPVVVRWDADGHFVWSDIQPVAVPVIAYEYAAAFGPDGRRAFGGLSSLGTGFPTDALVVAERDQARGYCFGDGQIAACPCGNDAPVGEGQGCTNSSGDAARFTAAGNASLVADTGVLTVRGVPPNAFSLFVQGSAAVAPLAFGDGLRCVGQNLKRMYVHAASGGVASAPSASEPSLSARSAALGDPIAAGTQRFYQVYYRDVQAGFCSAGGNFNVSNALSIRWGP